MVEISHQKAQAFTQAAADSMLPADSRALLDTHLAACQECREYASSLKSLETRLRSISHAQWDDQRSRLNLGAVINPPGIKIIWSNVFGLTQGVGKATIILALVLGYFLIANLGNHQLPIPGTKAPTSLPTPNELLFSAATSPTPLSPSTLIGLTTQGCVNISYVIQVDDTLEEIALQFGISKELIAEHNNLETDGLSPGLELSIPVCDHTPSHTPSTPSNTITITPLIETVLPAQRE